MSDLVFAPKASQFTLSTILQTVSSLVLLVYISIALGCAIIAVFSDIMGKLKKNKQKEEFAANCIQIATGNFGVGFLFGVVPALSIFLSYSQFLFGQHTPVSEYFLWAALFNLIGLLFLNKYREAFHLKKHAHESAEAQDVLEDAQTAISYSGPAGVAFLLVGSYFLVGGSAIAIDPGLWQYGFIVIFSSIQVWLKYAAFLCGAIGLAGVALIFFFHSWNGGLKHVSEEIKESALLGGSTLAIVFIPLYVIFTGLHLKFIPRADFSLSICVFSALAIFVLFIALHMVYYTLAHKNIVAGHLGFIFCILSFLFVILADNDTRENALRKQTFQLIKNSPAGHSGASSGSTKH